jgi:hypothetical protein
MNFRDFPAPPVLQSELMRAGVRVDGNVRDELTRYAEALGRLAYLSLSPDQRSAAAAPEGATNATELEAVVESAAGYLRGLVAAQPKFGVLE